VEGKIAQLDCASLAPDNPQVIEVEGISVEQIETRQGIFEQLLLEDGWNPVGHISSRSGCSLLDYLYTIGTI